MERRQHPRKNVIDSQLVTVGLPGEGATSRRGILLDVSEGGMSVQPFVPLTPGTSSGIEIELAGSEPPIRGTGLIAWVGPGGRAGIRFIDMPPEAREQLRRLFRVDPQQENRDRVAPASASPDEELLDLDSALELIAARARDIAAATGVAVALADEDGITCRVSTGEAPDVGARLQPNSGLSGYCVRTGELVYCADALEDPRIDPEVARQLNVRSIVIVPVFAGGRVAGLLEVLSAFPNAFEARQIVRLQRVADLLSGTIEEGFPHNSDLTEAVGTVCAPSPLAFAEPDSYQALPDPVLRAAEPVSAAAVAAPALTPPSELPNSVPEPAAPEIGASQPKPAEAHRIQEPLATISADVAPVDIAKPGSEVGDTPVMPAPQLVPLQDFEFTPVPVSSKSISAPEKSKKSGSTRAKKKGLPVHRIGPVFLASSSGSGGEVVLGATITEKGTVGNIRMISGPKMLGKAAADAVSQWRCQPYELNGDPMEVETTITIHFTPSK